MIRVLENNGSMTNGEFVSRIEELYHSYFPDSACQATLQVMTGDPFCSIKCWIAKDSSEVSSNIMGNDLFHVVFFIWNFDSKNPEDAVPSDLELEPHQRSIKTIPENKYMVYGAERLPFRKTKGDANKILKTLDKYFKTLYDTTVRLAEEDKIPSAPHEIQNNEFVRSKLGI